MSTERTIRSARLDDAPAMLDIYAHYVRTTTISFEFEPPTVEDFTGRVERITATDPWLVMEQDGAIAGYAYASAFRSRAGYATTRETTVYVHPDLHRAGVGRELLTAVLGEIAERGARTAIAVIGLPNDASVALHEALGFTHVGTLHEIARKFDTWLDEGFWELSLARDRPR